MRKALVTLGALTLVLTVGACSSGSSSSSSTSSEATQAAPAPTVSDASASPQAEAKGELMLLTYLDYDGPNLVFDDLLTRCSESTGYTFKKLVVPQNELITKATQLTATGDAPAIIVADNNNVATLADIGLLSELSLEGSGLSETDFLSGPYRSGTYEDVLYGLPMGNNGEVLIYNKKLLDEAGVSVPTTWKELQDAAKKLTEGDRYGFGYTFTGGETTVWNWLTQLWSNGGSLTDLADSKSVEAANFWTSFILDGTAPKSSLDSESWDVAPQVIQGNLAMAQVGTWTLPGFLADAKKAGVEVGIAPQVSPIGDAPVTPFGGEVLTVGKGAEGPAREAINQCILAYYSDPEKLTEYSVAMGFVPAYIPGQAAVLAKAPELAVLAEQLKGSRGRTEEVGADYATYTTAIGSALQKIATGVMTPQEAMQEAADAVK